MKIEHIAPEGLLPSEGYSQVVMASGEKTVHVAGQGAFDKEMNLIGEGDYHGQTLQAFKNLTIAFSAAGAKLEQVVSSVIYVVNLNPETVEGIVSALHIAHDGLPFPPNASSLIGVESLMVPGMLVEISAVAVID